MAMAKGQESKGKRASVFQASAHILFAVIG